MRIYYSTCIMYSVPIGTRAATTTAAVVPISYSSRSCEPNGSARRVTFGIYVFGFRCPSWPESKTPMRVQTCSDFIIITSPVEIYYVLERIPRKCLRNVNIYIFIWDIVRVHRDHNKDFFRPFFDQQLFYFWRFIFILFSKIITVKHSNYNEILFLLFKTLYLLKNS